MVAEDVVNRPTACANLFGNGYCGVSIAANPVAPFPFPRKGKALLQHFKEQVCQISKSLKEATLAGSIFCLLMDCKSLAKKCQL
ncbi:MAG: hypothetical protein Q8T08_15485 [Ignavibacteria bacterium]|nr:hypothetical protein [Ignavibacteria bacterium]